MKMVQFGSAGHKLITTPLSDIEYLVMTFDIKAKRYWGHVTVADQGVFKVHPEIIEKLARELMPPEVHGYK